MSKKTYLFIPGNMPIIKMGRKEQKDSNQVQKGKAMKTKKQELRWVADDTPIRIDLQKIPKLQNKLLADALIKAAERFYSDPKNVAGFEAWMAERGAS